VLVFLDDDIRFGPQLLEAYARAFGDESVLGVAGQILEDSAKVVFDLPEKALAPATGWLAFPRNYGRRCSTSWMASGNFGIRKELFLKLGGMDENYIRGAFREESDFAMRFTKGGYRFQFEPAASVYHLGIAEAPTGGSRNWTGNNRIAGWHHCIGDWYFFLGHATAATAASLLWFSVRHFVLSRHNVTRPWLIPLLLARWLAGIFPAAYLRCRGARLLSDKQALQFSSTPKTIRELTQEVEA
jgi:GT2 family glycosyltransferase